MIKDYRHIGGRTYSTSGPGAIVPPAMTYYSWDGVPKETRGEKFFELSNHLGNVLSVVSDRKLPVDDGLGTIAYYQPDVVSYSDYYPFGMQMPERNGSTGEYRYGFQGQEKDDEIKGEGNSLNYTFRMHDPRVGRFFAVDPLTNKYPWYTPYQFSGNKVIHMVELEGLEEGDPYSDVTYVDKLTSSFEWNDKCRECGTAAVKEVQTREFNYKDGIKIETTTAVTVKVDVQTGEVLGVYQWTRTVVTNVITGEKETLPINNASILEGNQDIKTASVPDRLRTIVLEIQENKISPSETEATENESSNDTKTKVGQATAAAGVAIFDLGLSMDASVVGAVPGVILNVIGGVVTGVGAAVSFWPDSEEDPSKIKVEFTPYEVRSTPKEDE